MNIHYDDANKC